MKDRRSILAVALAMLTFSAIGARADDWNQWGGTPERNMPGGPG